MALIAACALLWSFVGAAMVSADTVGGASTGGCVRAPSFVMWQGSTGGYVRFKTQYRLRLEGPMTVGIRWELANGQVGPTLFYRAAAGQYPVWFKSIVFDGMMPPDMELTPGSSTIARLVLRPVAADAYSGCYDVSGVAVQRIPLNGEAPPAGGGGGFATPSPTPTGAPTPTPAPSSPACSAEPGFTDEECPPPDGYCYGYGPPDPGEAWPIYECEVAEATPTPTPDTGCSTTIESVTIDFGGTEYPFRKVTYCELAFVDFQEWRLISGSWQNCELDSWYGGTEGVTVLAGETTAYQRATLGANDLGAGSVVFEVAVERIGGHLEGDASCGVTRTDGAYQHGAWSTVTPGTTRNMPGVGVSAGMVLGPSFFVDACLSCPPNDATFTSAELWLGPALGSGNEPWEGTDVSPSPSPSPSTSPTATPPPPSLPPGWATPSPATGFMDPDGDGWTVGPPASLDGEDGLDVLPSHGTGNGSGAGECEGVNATPVTAKVGYVPPGAAKVSPGLEFFVGQETLAHGGNGVLGLLFGTLNWIGSNISATVDNTMGEMVWIWNQGVDATVPGVCIGEIVETKFGEVLEIEPFATYTEVEAQVAAAMAGAGGEPPSWCIPLPGGGEECLPLSDWAATVAPARNVSAVFVWLMGALGVLNIITGSFHVVRAGVGGRDDATVRLDRP